MLFIAYSTGQDMRVSVDGAAEGGNILASSYSNVLLSRSYSTNQVIPVVSGLSQGLHTVKIRNNAAVGSYNVYGFEILHESSNVLVMPGVSGNGAVYQGSVVAVEI